jgi:alpha-L-fucosidase
MPTRRDTLAASIAALAAGGLPAFAAPPPRPYNTPPSGVGPLIPARPEAIDRFMAMRYGAFLHWGPATVLGKEISWTRQIETPAAEYDAQYKRFNPTDFDADAWVRMLKDAGFRYATFVTKHHDGFAMWNTATTDHSVMHTPFGRDVLKEFAAACHRQGLALCLYYSIADVYQPDCIGARYANGLDMGPPGRSLPDGQAPSFDRYVAYMKAQLTELSRNYGPVTAWWFDGGWMPEWTTERGIDLLRTMRMLQPDTLTDQRVGGAYNGRVYMPTWFPADHDYVGDFAVLEVDMPRFNRDIPWEYTTPANGRSYCWTPGPYLDPTVWIDTFAKSACGDGNYLLGLTPSASGRFDPALVDKLAMSSAWIRRYGDCLFGTRGGPWRRTGVYGATCRGNRVFLQVFDATLTTVVLPPIAAHVIGCTMPNGGKAHVAQSAEGVTVTIAASDMESPVTIVALDLDRSAEALVPVGEVPVNLDGKVRSSNVDPALDALASDGSMATAWKADGQTKQPWLVYDLGKERMIARAILFEGAYEGELANIHHYVIETRLAEDQPWKGLADARTWGFDTGMEEDFYTWPISVFHPELRFAPTQARHVRLKILKAVAPPVVHAFELYER